MIIKGKLHQISGGIGQRGGSQFKYDFVEIGEYTIQKVTIQNYLRDRMKTLMGHEIEVSIMKRFFVFPKSIVAIRTANGHVYSSLDPNNKKWGYLTFGKIMLGAVLLIYLIIPYGIISGLCGSIFYSIGLGETFTTILTAILIIAFHTWFTKKCYFHLTQPVQVFGQGKQKTQVI